MKKWKWLAALALVAMALLAGIALADDSFVVEDGVLTGYTGSDTVVVIPEDLGITEIGERAFYNMSTITSVTVPEGVTFIGNYAFYSCTKLTEVSLPESLTGLGNHAFSICRQLTSVSLPEAVTTIGAGAFSSDWSMTSVTLPSGLKIIPDAAFSSCRFTEVTLPEGLEKIGRNAFSNCSSLTRVDIPASVTYVDAYAFDSCYRLAQATFAGDQTRLGSGVFMSCSELTNVDLPAGMTSLPTQSFYRCISLEEIVIPDGVTTIGSDAFHECYELKRVHLPAALTAIDYMAFYRCGQLEEINLPDSLKTIGSNAFYQCTALKDIRFGSGLQTIAKSAFFGCEGLTMLRFPAGLAEIGESAFQDCTGLRQIDLPMNLSSIGLLAFMNCPQLRDVTIPAATTSVGQQAFEGCYALRKLDFLGAQTDVGLLFSEPERYSVVIHCEVGSKVAGMARYMGLKVVYHNPPGDEDFIVDEHGGLMLYNGSDAEVVVPGYVTEIKAYAFYECDWVTSVTLPDTLTVIEEAAFAKCTSLESITIPAGVSCIGENAFQDCDALQNIEVEAGSAWFMSIDGVVYDQIDGEDELCLLIYPAGRAGAFTVPENVTVIGIDAFCRCKGLTAVTLPTGGALDIKWGAFEGCDNLADIYYNNSWVKWNEQVFIAQYNDPLYDAQKHFACLAEGPCGDDASLYLDNDGLLTITGTGLIDCVMFYPEDVRSAIVGEGITGIGEGFFNGCVNMTDITLPRTLTYIGTQAFGCCKKLTVLNLPAGLTEIGENPFLECDALESLSVEEGCEAFAVVDGVLFSGDMTALIAYPTPRQGAYTVPDGVTHILAGAFWSCKDLTAVTLPYSLTYVGMRAFNNCPWLSDIYYLGDEDDWQNVTVESENDQLYWSRMHYDKAVSYPITGSCGDTVSYVLDADGVLTFSGEGAINVVSPVPKENVVKIIVEEGLEGFAGGGMLMVFPNLTEVSLPDSALIPSGMFAGCHALQTVRLPEGLTELPTSMFENCNFLKSFTVPDTVTRIGTTVFSGCTRMETVVLPEGITVIGTAAFANCWALESITLPESLTTLGSSVFEGCTSLESLVIPENVTECQFGCIGNCPNLREMTIRTEHLSLQNGMFTGASNLLTVTLADGIDSIEPNAFYGSNPLFICTPGSAAEAAVLAAGLGLYRGDPFNIENGVLVRYVGQDKDVVVPDGVTAIGDGAFKSRMDIRSVALPEGLTSIGERAFEACFDLTGMELPASLTQLATTAFIDCDNIASFSVAEGNTAFTAVDGVLFTADMRVLVAWPQGRKGEYSVPDGVTALEEWSFANGYYLTKLSIPASLVEVRKNATLYCGNLWGVTDRGGELAFNNIDVAEGNEVFDEAEHIFPCLAAGRCGTNAEYALDDRGLMTITGTGAIGAEGLDAVRNSCLVSAIEIGEGITEIGDGAFSDFIGLTRLALPESLIRIGNDAFSGCQWLDQIDLPEGLTAIGTGAFSGCECLREVTVPANVGSLDIGAFSGCAMLERIVMEGDETALTDVTGASIPGVLICANGSAADTASDGMAIDVAYAGSGRFVVEEGVLTAVNGRFHSVSIPEGVTAIGQGAFAGDRRLCAINLHEGLTSIGTSAFENCTGIRVVTLPASVSTLGENAFAGCAALEEIDVLNPELTLDAGMFAGCGQLRIIGCYQDSGADAFAAASETCQAVYFEDDFDIDEGGVLTGYTGSEARVVVPDSVTAIGDGAFAGNATLERVILPEGVTAIGEGAFANCAALSYIRLPASLEQLGTGVFTGCAALETVELDDTNDSFTWRGDVMYSGDMTRLVFVLPGYSGPLLVPEGVVEILPHAADGCANITFVDLKYGLQTIGEGAFSGAVGLTEVVLPNSVDESATAAFPESVRTLWMYELENAYYGKRLTGYNGTDQDVTIPGDLDITVIGPTAFNDNYFITAVTLPESVEIIEDGAFSGCNGLECVRFPAIVLENSQIEAGAFASSGVQRFEMIGESDMCSAEDGVLFADYGSELTLIKYPAGRRGAYTVPDGTTSIDGWAFNGCLGLTEVSLPESLKAIGEEAFKDCRSLDSLNLPNSVTYIGEGAFRASGVRHVSLPEGMTLLRGSVFEDCINLEHVEGLEGIATLSNRAFYNCGSLETVNLMSAMTIGREAFSNVMSLRSVSLSAFGNGLEIKYNAFDNCVGLEEVRIYGDPEAWGKTRTNAENGNYILTNCPPTYMDMYASGAHWGSYMGEGGRLYVFGYDALTEGAFAGDANITSVVISGSIYRLREGAFMNCVNLSDVTLSDRVTVIDDLVFSGCTKLKELTLPQDLAIFGYKFADYYEDDEYRVKGHASVLVGSGVERINVARENPYFISVDGVLYSGPSFYERNYADEQLSARPDGQGRFIPLGTGSDEWAPALVLMPPARGGEYSVHEGTYIIINGAFAHSSVTGVSVPDGVEVDRYAFAFASNMTHVRLPDDLEYIDSGTFLYCTSLTNVDMPENISYINNNAFRQCAALRDIDLSRVGYIGDDAFAGCASLESVDLSNLLNQYDSSSVFAGCTGLKDVVLGDGISYIGSGMFADCTNLETIRLGINTETVGYYAFMNCENLREAWYEGSRQGWSNNVTVYPGNECLLNALSCEYIDTGECGDGVEFKLDAHGLLTIFGEGRIRESYFAGESGIVNVEIGEGVTSIDAYAFDGCPNLESVSLPASMLDINTGAFGRCPKLHTVQIAEGNTTLTIVDGILYDSVMYTLHVCIDIPDSGVINVPAGVEFVSGGAFAARSALEEVVLPDSVTEIGRGAFQDDVALRRVIMTDNVETIGENLFYGCASLNDVTLSDQLITLPDNTFRGCASLRQIDLPVGLADIGKCAFLGAGLESVTLPQSVEAVRTKAFKNCKALTEVVLPDTLETIGSYAFDGCSALRSIGAGPAEIGAYLLDGYRSVEGMRMPANLQSIGVGAFLNCTGLESALKMPEGLRAIGNYAFYGCGALSNIELSDWMDSIGSYAFSGCASLQSLCIPDGISVLETGTVANCASMETLFLPWTLCSIEASATNGMTNLGAIYMIGMPTLNEVNIDERGNVDFNEKTSFFQDMGRLGDGLWYGYTLGEMNTVGKGEIGEGDAEAFDKYLYKILVGEGVTSIAARAFADNNDLIEIELPATLESFDPRAVEGCAKLQCFKAAEGGRYSSDNGVLYCDDGAELARFPQDVSQDYIMPEGVLRIGDRAFEGCAMTSVVTLSEDLTAIGREAFANTTWTAADTLTLPAGVTSIGERAFAGCDGLNAILLPEGLTEIPAGAFEGSSVTEIAVPESVTAIGAGAFTNCLALEAAQLPSGVMALPERLFAGCAALHEIELPEGLTAVGSEAFNGCASLTWLVLPESVTEIGDYVFDGCDGLTAVFPDVRMTIGATHGGYTVCCYMFSDADLYLDGTGCDMLYIDETTFAQLGGAMALEVEDATLATGDGIDLGLTITPAFLRGVKPTWTSSAPEVAAVDAQGRVSALTNGQATITAAIGEVSVTAEIRVFTALTGLHFEESEYWVEAKQTVVPVLIREPEDASETLTWTVSDPLRVELREDGSVYAKAPSVVTLTVKSERGVTAACELHIIYPLKAIRLDADSLEMQPGETRVLTATAVDRNDDEYTGRLVRFESDDETVARVDSVTGEITAVARGSADIRVSNAAGTVTATCHVTVREAFVPMDEPDFVLPAALTAIDEEAFSGLPMQVVMCPEGLTSIGARAFADCTGLRQIYIPETVVTIADDAFEHCPEGLTVYGRAGSEAERVALACGFGFMEMED